MATCEALSFCGQPGDHGPLITANTAFALDLFNALSHEDPKANLFFSPFSVSSALSKVYLGTRGRTEAQLAKTLHFDTVKEIHLQFQSLNSAINKPGSSYILKAANRLYGERSYKFLQEFLDLTKQIYSAELATVDFQCASKEARQMINEWVKAQTEGKIPELLTPGVVDSTTKLVLVNAIYFKGNWLEEFDKMDTYEIPFKLNKKDTKEVKMMFQKDDFPLGYIKKLKCQVLELPYQGKELSMVILLPDDIQDKTTGLQKIEKKMSLQKLNEWTKPENMPIVEVIVGLPSFKLEETYSLNSHLARLGLTQLFDSSQADLSGMSGTRDLFISKIVHKSFVEVNEEGTEATAATWNFANLSSRRPDNHFVCDHPFLILHHNASHAILFLGRFASP